MQSLASLMSMKQSDIGNLDDFNDSDDEVGEERRANFGTGQATHVTGKTGDTLEDHWDDYTKLTCSDILRRNPNPSQVSVKSNDCQILLQILWFIGTVSHICWTSGQPACGPSPSGSLKTPPSPWCN